MLDNRSQGSFEEDLFKFAADYPELAELLSVIACDDRLSDEQKEFLFKEFHDYVSSMYS